MGTYRIGALNLPRSITPNIPINSHVLCITEEILHYHIHHASARSAAFQLPCVRVVYLSRAWKSSEG
jgi:hypothetical protein